MSGSHSDNAVEDEVLDATGKTHEPPVLHDVVSPGKRTLLESRRFGEAALAQLAALSAGQHSLDIEDKGQSEGTEDKTPPAADKEALGKQPLPIDTPLSTSVTPPSALQLESPLGLELGQSPAIAIDSPLRSGTNRMTGDPENASGDAAIAAADAPFDEDIDGMTLAAPLRDTLARDAASEVKLARRANSHADTRHDEEALELLIDELIEHHAEAFKHDLKRLLRRIAATR